MSYSYPFKLLAVERIPDGIRFTLRVQVGSFGFIWIRGFRFIKGRLRGPSIRVNSGPAYLAIVRLNSEQRRKVIGLAQEWMAKNGL